MLHTKLNGKKLEIPTSYEELSWSKFKRLVSIDEDTNYELRVLETILELPHNTLDNETKVENVYLAIQAVQFMNKKPNALKTEVTLDGHTTTLSDGIGNLPFIMYKDAETVVAGSSNDTEKLETLACLYLHYHAKLDEVETKRKNKELGAVEYEAEMKHLYKYSDATSNEWRDKVGELPCEDVLSIGTFFLSRLVSSRLGTKTTYRLVHRLANFLYTALTALKRMGF